MIAKTAKTESESINVVLIIDFKPFNVSQFFTKSKGVKRLISDTEYCISNVFWMAVCDDIFKTSGFGFQLKPKSPN